MEDKKQNKWEVTLPIVNLICGMMAVFATGYITAILIEVHF